MEEPLTKRQQQRIEKNRQRALQLKNSKLMAQLDLRTLEGVFS